MDIDPTETGPQTGGPGDHLRSLIRDVPDFPREGILFKDITTLLSDPVAFADAVGALASAYAGQRIDAVVGIESRGFILGGAIAHILGAGFIPVRKQGRLPAPTHSVAYELEYGEAVLQIHVDALLPGRRALIVDDLLATGGTAAATIALVEAVGAEVAGLAFLIELEALGGAAALGGRSRVSLLTY